MKQEETRSEYEISLGDEFKVLMVITDSRRYLTFSVEIDGNLKEVHRYILGDKENLLKAIKNSLEEIKKRKWHMFYGLIWPNYKERAKLRGEVA